MRWLMIVLSLILASCANSPFVAVEESGLMTLNRYQTFSIEDLSTSLPHETSKALFLLPITLKNTLESSLEDKNLKPSTMGQVPDLTIQLSVHKISVWDIFEYPMFVSFPDHQQEYYLAHSFRYEMGRVNIRMIDSASGKIIWEAGLSTPLVHSDEQAAMRLNESIGKLF